MIRNRKTRSKTKAHYQLIGKKKVNWDWQEKSKLGLARKR